MMNEPLSSIMTTDLVTVHPKDKLSKVRDIFLNTRIHHLPVVDDAGDLVGLLTTYDLFRLERTLDEYHAIPVDHVMTRRLAKLEPHQKIGVAAEIFLENLFHAVPIVEGNKLVGIVTTFDVLKYEFDKAYPAHAMVHVR
ncbi:MAG: CBS domain-containing protein [Saprospiraceae bacterium]|nr:CBS domain-containing protein [Saprospiraceae bacterium]